MSVVAKAKELKKELGKLPEYKELLTAEQEVEADEEAKQILADFQAAQQEIHQAHELNEEIPTELKRRLKELKQKMQQNDKINAYMKAQQEFNQIMEQVNDTVFSVLDLETSEDCGHGCDSGDCCH